MESRPVIVQHCFGELGNGGPIGALHRILQSELAEKYDFKICIQDRPAGGINIPLIYEMARRIKSFHPDLLHVRGLQNEGFHGLCAGRIAGCRRILVSVHGFAGDVIYPDSRIRQKIVSALLEPITLRLSDGVYCVSEHASRRREITRHARRHLGYVHNAVQLPEHPPGDFILRRRFGFDDGDVVGICVARMTREKGVYDLLEAMRILDVSGTRNLKLVLVGDGIELGRLRSEASNLSNVKVLFLGRRFDVPDLLSASDMFILPSLHENLSNALLEAMSHSLPVVASNVGGNPEAVIDGETGILVPPENPGALAEGISVLLENPSLRKRMGAAGRKRIGEEFSIPVLMKNLSRIYDSMLGS